MNVPSMYYFLSSPYLFGEMDLAVQRRITHIKKHSASSSSSTVTTNGSTTNSNGAANTAPAVSAVPIPTVAIAKSTQIARLRKQDSACNALRDDKGRIMLSATCDRAIADKHLMIYWTDGATRFAPYSLMQNISRSLALNAVTAAATSSKDSNKDANKDSKEANGNKDTNSAVPAAAAAQALIPQGQRDAHVFCTAMGGSLGLNAHILDDKIEMQSLLLRTESCRARQFIPWTVPFCTKEKESSTPTEEWKDTIRELLSGPPDFENQHVIFKPSDALKQKGIIVLLRHPSKIDIALSHIMTTTRSASNKQPYYSWVVQSFVVDPFMVSGLDLGLLINQTIPSHLLPPGQSPVNSPSSTYHTIPSLPLNDKEKEKDHHDRNRSPSPTKSNRKAVASKDASNSTTTPVSSSPSSSTATSTTKKKKKLPKLSVAIPENSTSSNSENVCASPLSSPRRSISGNGSIPSELQAAPSGSPVPTAPADPSITNILGPSTYTHDPSHVKHTPNVELPSDSNEPVLLNGMYKVHFRIYAMVRHDIETNMFDIYGCRLFKIYHAAQPSALLTTVKQEKDTVASRAAHAVHDDPYVLLHAKSNSTAATPPISASPYLIDTRDVENFACGVSNCLAMRMGNEILSPALVDKFLPQFHDIIRDTTETAIAAGGFGSFGMARVGFQILGYDFLYDTAADKPVLLEVNNNVGQGMHPKKEMLAQGMSEIQYTTLHSYWTHEYREPFCDGVVQHALDPLFGLNVPPLKGGAPVFVHLSSVPQPAITPKPDIYAYSHGVPPPSLVKRKNYQPDQPRATSPEKVSRQESKEVKDAKESKEVALATSKEATKEAPAEIGTVINHNCLDALFAQPLSTSHSASPSSPFSGILSIRSASVQQQTKSSPSPSVSPQPELQVNTNEAPSAIVHGPVSSPTSIFSNSASEIEDRASTIITPTPVSMAPARLAPSPPTTLPMTTGAQLRNFVTAINTTQQRPPLTIRFSSMKKTKELQVPRDSEEKTREEEKMNSPPIRVGNFLPSPPPTISASPHQNIISIRRQGSLGFKPVAGDSLEQSKNIHILAPRSLSLAPQRVSVPLSLTVPLALNFSQVISPPSSAVNSPIAARPPTAPTASVAAIPFLHSSVSTIAGAALKPKAPPLPAGAISAPSRPSVRHRGVSDGGGVAASIRSRSKSPLQSTPAPLQERMAHLNLVRPSSSYQRSSLGSTTNSLGLRLQSRERAQTPLGRSRVIPSSVASQPQQQAPVAIVARMVSGNANGAAAAMASQTFSYPHVHLPAPIVSN